MPNFAFASGGPNPLPFTDNDRRFMVVYTDHTRVSGVLEGNAKLLQHADGSIAVAVRIKQPSGLPVLAELGYGRDATARKAALLAAGEFVHGRHVQASGQGLGLDWSQTDALALELQACSDIALSMQPLSVHLLKSMITSTSLPRGEAAQ